MQDTNGVLTGIKDKIVSLFGSKSICLFNDVLNLAKEVESVNDKILLTKLARFILFGGELANDIESAFDKRVLFGNEEEDIQYFVSLLSRLNQINEEEKIRYFAMLCRARVVGNLDRYVFERIYATILTCTVSELEYIKTNFHNGITDKEITITIFSLMREGLVQKSYNEVEKNNRFYFTDYANIVYRYALNYNGVNTGENLQLVNITIKEDNYALNKIANLSSLPDLTSNKPAIDIRDIKSTISINNACFELQFIIGNQGIEIAPDRVYFAFISRSDYYVCRRYNCKEYFNRNLQGNKYSIKYAFDKANLRSCVRYGIIFFFVVKSTEKRYIKIFHYGNGYTSQEISQEAYEKEINQIDRYFTIIEDKNNINVDTTDFYMRLSECIMNYSYTKE